MGRSVIDLKAPQVRPPSNVFPPSSIAISPGLFAIDGTSGVVTVTGNVDFESGQEHELSVEASDNGNPKRSNVVTLHIEVINVEDEPPQFPISFYTTSVSEGSWSLMLDRVVIVCALCSCSKLNISADCFSYRS